MSHISVSENGIVALINVFNVEPQNLNSSACPRIENENSKGITRDRNDHSSTNTCGGRRMYMQNTHPILAVLVAAVGLPSQ